MMAPLDGDRALRLRSLAPTAPRTGTADARCTLPAALALGLALAAGFAASGCGGARPPRETPSKLPIEQALTRIEAAPIRMRGDAAWHEIARLEDARSTGGGRLQALLVDADPELRARAARALGRIPLGDEAEIEPSITLALCKALEDAEPAVRAEAAFALGQRADPASAGLLLGYMQDVDAHVRARLVEAASKFDHPALQTAVLRALPDPEESVRVEAALGAARWKREAADAAAIDSALIAALRPLELPQAGEAPVGSAFADALIYALARRQSEKGRGAFLEHLSSPSTPARIHSAKGLASLKPDASIAASLRHALRDADWRVAYEAATALASSGDEASVDDLLRAVEHPSAHVRAAALGALGSFPQARARSQAALERGLLDISASVRAAALRSLTLVVEPASALVRVRAAAADADAVVRRGAAQAAAGLPGEAGLSVLEELARDRNLMVAGAALEGLGALPSERARDVLAQYVTHADDGLKLGAVQALRRATTSSDVPRYRQALSQARSEIRSELACNVALSLGGIGGEDARELLEELLQDRDMYVRQRAQELLREKFARETAYDKRPPLVASNRVPQAGKDAPLWTHNPLVVIVTTRGEMVFELFAEEAPLHVHNLLELASRNAYDGLSFHRVVPDFVVQGGDKRGDGNGGVSWRGDSLRAEFSARKFERGSLGMPRNDDPDSGGSQIFVTHRATPHLDGRYTVFGQLRAGFEVLDLIEVGDRILDVRPAR